MSKVEMVRIRDRSGVTICLAMPDQVSSANPEKGRRSGPSDDRVSPLQRRSRPGRGLDGAGRQRHDRRAFETPINDIEIIESDQGFGARMPDEPNVSSGRVVRLSYPRRGDAPQATAFEFSKLQERALEWGLPGQIRYPFRTLVLAFIMVFAAAAYPPIILKALAAAIIWPTAIVGFFAFWTGVAFFLYELWITMEIGIVNEEPEAE